MPSRGDSRDKPSPREENTQGESYSVPEQQHSETDLSSDAHPPSQGAANHPHRAFRVCELDSSSRVDGRYISLEQVTLAVRTQGFPPGDSGISPDGFPSRSVEEGGVSGLFSQRESITVSDSSTGSEMPSSSSTGAGSAQSYTSEVYDGSVHTARAVPILRLSLGQPGDERPGENRLPSPAGLDRIDNEIDDAERVWTDYPFGVARQTQESDEHDDGRLTGGREMSIKPHARGSDLRAVGQRGSPPSSRPHYTRGNAPRHAGRFEGHHPVGGHHTQPQRVSSTPSESSISETVFNVRQRSPSPHTPPKPRSERIPGPSLRQQTTAASGSCRGPTRGPSHPASVVEQEPEAVPAVLVPGALFGLGGSHPRLPPQAIRSQGRGASGGDDKRKGRGRRGE